MDTNSDTGSPAIDLAQAFEALRGEVSLTRRALEGLTAARERIPDYSPTLAKLGKQIEVTIAQTEAIRQAPAITLTRDGVAKRMIEASVLVRAEDARLLHETRDALSRSIGKIDGIVERGQAAARQWRDKLWCAAGGVIAGILLWSVLPGPIARSLPASWHVPEWMAARTMGMTRHEAGQALLRSDPAAEKSR